MLDGTPLVDAINIIDTVVDPQPICYMTNCIHPTNLKKALSNGINKDHPLLGRFKGIQANTSNKCVDELTNNDVLQHDNFQEMINEMQFLYEQFGLKIFGGCCGTNDIFIDDLARKMISAVPIKSSGD